MARWDKLPVFPRLDSMDARRAGKHAKASRAHKNMERSIDYKKHAIFSLLTDDEWSRICADKFGSYRKIAAQWRPGDVVGHYSISTERGEVLIRNCEIVLCVTTMCISRVTPDDYWISKKKEFDELGGFYGLVSRRFVWQKISIGITFRITEEKIIVE